MQHQTVRAKLTQSVVNMVTTVNNNESSNKICTEARSWEHGCWNLSDAGARCVACISAYAIRHLLDGAIAKVCVSTEGRDNTPLIMHPKMAIA